MPETIKLVLALNPENQERASLIINDTTICCGPLSAMDLLYDKLRKDIEKALVLLNIHHTCYGTEDQPCKHSPE